MLKLVFLHYVGHRFRSLACHNFLLYFTTEKYEEMMFHESSQGVYEL